MPSSPISVTDNLLLAAIYGGVIYGLGLGLIYRAGDTTGGIDIVAKFVRRKYPYMNFGTIILILDIIIYAAFAIIFNEFEAAMYAVIAMFVVTRVIDLVLYGLGTSKVCYIISDESEKLKNAITATLGRGVTLLKGEAPTPAVRRTSSSASSRSSRSWMCAASSNPLIPTPS